MPCGDGAVVSQPRHLCAYKCLEFVCWSARAPREMRSRSAMLCDCFPCSCSAVADTPTPLLLTYNTRALYCTLAYKSVTSSSPICVNATLHSIDRSSHLRSAHFFGSGSDRKRPGLLVWRFSRTASDSVSAKHTAMQQTATKRAIFICEERNFVIIVSIDPDMCSSCLIISFE